MLLATIAPVFFIFIAGFLIRRVGLLSAVADASLLRICVNVLYPGLIVVAIVGNDALHQGINVWLPPLTAFLTVVFGYLVSYAGARVLRLPRGSETRTFTYVTGLYNYGYMAIPMVAGLFGAKTLGVLLTFNLGVEIAFWGGASLILASKSHRGENGWRGLVNTPVIAILLSLILNFALGGQHLPEWIVGAFRMLGASAIPMALLLTGATMSDFLAEARGLRSGAVTMASACLLRLGLLPLVFLSVARWLPCSVDFMAGATVLRLDSSKFIGEVDLIIALKSS